MDSISPERDKCSLFSKMSAEKGSSFIRNIPYAMLARENGLSRYQNQLASELQIAAEEQLTRKQFEETKCQLPDVTRSTYLVVFSPDGKKMASSHGNHNVYVTDVKTGKNLNTLSGHPRTPWCIAFHPSSNQILASGCLGGQVRVWDLHGGSEIWTVEGQTSIASLAFHPTDRLLVVASYNEILFWDWSQPEPFAKCCTQNEKEKIRYVAFDFAGTKLITGIENPQPLQSQWDRVGPVRYVPHTGSSRGPRPVGPRPGFGSIFSHSNTSPGSDPGPTSHPVSTANGGYNSAQRSSSQLPTSYDERRRMARHFTRVSPGQVSRPVPTTITTSLLQYQDERRNTAGHFMTPRQASRTPPSSTATSANEHSVSNANSRVGTNVARSEDTADYQGPSWMWRPQHPSGEISNPQSLSSNRFRLWPMLSRRNAEYGRLRSASRNHRRHLQVLLDQCRRSRGEQNLPQTVQLSPSSSSSNALSQDLVNNGPLPHSSSSTSGPVGNQSGHVDSILDDISVPQSLNRGSNEQSEANSSSSTADDRNRSSGHDQVIPPQRSNTVQQLSSLSQDLQCVFRVLLEHINSMQQCSHCQPRIDLFRLRHIRQSWEEMQGQIRSLQVGIWENAGSASNAWHRFSFEAITEMLSHMSHRDRIEERLSSSSRLADVPAGHARERSSNTALSSTVTDESSTPNSSSVDVSHVSHPTQFGPGSDVEELNSTHNSRSMESALPSNSSTSTPIIDNIAHPTSRSPCSLSTLTTELSAKTSSNSDGLPSSSQSSSTASSVPRTDHAVPNERERESLHITWVDRNTRGTTAVGVVSRRDVTNVGNNSTCSALRADSNSARGSALRGRLFRVRRHNMFVNSSLGSSDASRIHSSLPVQTSRISSENLRAPSEPRAALQSSPAASSNMQPTCRRRSSSTGTLTDSQENQSLSLPAESSNSLGWRVGQEEMDTSIGTYLPNTELTSSYYPFSRVGTRRITDQVSSLRCRLFLRKPRITAWRSPRFRSSNQATHISSRNFGGRRAVLEVTVGPSSLTSQQGTIGSNDRPEVIERTPENMLMRIFRSLRRDRQSNRVNDEPSSSSGPVSASSNVVPPVVEELCTTSEQPVPPSDSNICCNTISSTASPMTTTGANLSATDSGRQRWTHFGRNGDARNIRRAQSESDNSPSNLVHRGMVTEEWAHRLLRLQLLQQVRERQFQQHQARLHSRHSNHLPRGFDRHHRFGLCFCGSCVYISSRLFINQTGERPNSRVASMMALARQVQRPTNDGANTDHNVPLEADCFQRESSDNNQASNQQDSSEGNSSTSVQCPSNESFQSRTETDPGLNEEVAISGSENNPHPRQTVEENLLDQNSNQHVSSASTSPSARTSSSFAAVAHSSQDLHASSNHCKRLKVQNNWQLKPGHSSRLCSGFLPSSKLRVTAKGKEPRKRPFHQTNNRRKPTSLKTFLKKAIKEPRASQRQEVIDTSSSQPEHSQSADRQQPSISQISSQLPEPTFSQQLENILGRMDHLMLLQRNALNPSAGEQNGSHLDSSSSRTAGDGVHINHDQSVSSDAISVTSRLLTRLAESLVRQLQIVQQSHEHHNGCFNNPYNHFSAQSTSHGSLPSAHSRSSPISDTRQRAEELLSVMMENLGTFSRESTFGEVFSDNAVLAHIQTMSASFWLLQGLYMSLHLALELTDVLLSHIIATYQTNDTHEEPRAPLSQPCVCPTSSTTSPHPWMPVRSAFMPPHSWSHTSRTASSSTSVVDGRPSSSMVNTPLSNGSSRANETRISSRMRMISSRMGMISSRMRLLSSCGFRSTYSGQNNASGIPIPHGVSNSSSVARVFSNGSGYNIDNANSNHGSASSSIPLPSSQSERNSHHVTLSVPTVQVNDVPLSEINEWQSPSSSLSSSHEVQSDSQETHTSTSLNSRWASPLTSQSSLSAEGGRPGPFRVRPRLLHPHYSRYSQDPFLSSDSDYSAQSLLFHLDYSRMGGSFVREPFFSSEEHRIHRIQLWDFSEGIIPDISKADKNLVVAECKIHNDASVDVSAEGHLLVALLPISRTVLHPHLAPTVGQAVGVYSLVWESLGQLLYTTSLDQAAVSVALSPTSAYLLVGLVSRRTVLMPNDNYALAQIFRLEGARPGRPVGARGRLNLHRDIELQRDRIASSLNCIRWAPIPGQGFVYGTNTGALVMLR